MAMAWAKPEAAYTGPEASAGAAEPEAGEPTSQAAPEPQAGGNFAAAPVNFCHQCGSKVPPGAKFCSMCGAKLDVPAAEEPAGLDSAGEGAGQEAGGDEEGDPGAEPESEEEDEEDDDEDEEGDGAPDAAGGSADDDFHSLQAALLHHLVSGGKACSTGRLGFLVQAKKKPTAAALFALKDAGLAQMRDSIPPLWEATDAGKEQEESSGGGGPTVAVGRLAYNPERKKGKGKGKGARPGHGDFEILKAVVRNYVASKGRNGCTAGSVGYELGANRKAVNAALYACEKDGTAWAVGERASGVKARWGANPAPDYAHACLPAAYSYSGDKVGGGAQARPASMAFAAPPMGFPMWEAEAPPPKKPRHPNSPHDDFETLKLIVRGALQGKGEKGASSGQLGYELSAGRKHLTAALFSCESDGTVKNVAEEGEKPKWVCWVAPPEFAAELVMPEKFAYADPSMAAPQMAAPQMAWGAPQMGWDKGWGKGGGKCGGKCGGKGGGKWGGGKWGGGPWGQEAPCGDFGGNPVSRLSEWGQKSRRSVSFSEAGQDKGGRFVAQVLVDGRVVAQGMASNKKEAKKQAAEVAARQIGI